VPPWRRFNFFRSGTRIPGGEMTSEAQARATAEPERPHEMRAGERIIAVRRSAHRDPERDDHHVNRK
jgi:hypothetical protein